LQSGLATPDLILSHPKKIASATKKEGRPRVGEPSSAMKHSESAQLFGEKDLAKSAAHQLFEFFLRGIIHKNHLRGDFVSSL
jgi:hypothetical protein